MPRVLPVVPLWLTIRLFPTCGHFAMADTPTFQISAAGTAPQLLRAEDGGFSLRFDLPGGQAAFALNAAQVHTLGLSCLHHFPDIEPCRAVSSEDEAWRQPARIIGLANDYALQLLMRETLSDDLVAFLWYMKDAALARRIFANLSERAGELLFQDLDEGYGALHPDTAAPNHIEKARAATLTIVDTFNRLAAAGQILHP